MQGAISSQERQGILNYVQQKLDRDQSQVSDLLRLVCILAQCCQDDQYVNQVVQLVTEAKVLDQQQLALVNKLKSQNVARRQQAPQNQMLKMFQSVGQTVGLSRKNERLAMVNQVRLIIETIAKKTPLSHLQQYESSYIDCGTQRKSDSLNTLPRVVIVFAMGGGTFVENEMMQQLAADMLRDHKIQLLYGCDQVYSPQEYLKQMLQ